METEKIIQALIDFKYTAKPADFIELFGPTVGPHLWQEFVKSNHEPLKLYASLSGDNLAAFAQKIETMAQEI